MRRCGRFLTLTVSGLLMLQLVIISSPLANAADSLPGSFLTVDEMIKLREAGVSDQTIQRIIEREERERARYLGVTRTQKRADGTEQIIYGSVEPPPWPKTEYFHFNTDAKYLKTLFLNIEKDANLTAEDRKAWDILKNLRLYKMVDEDDSGPQ